MKTGFPPAHSQATVHSAFKGQLEDAIEERKGGTKDPKQRGAGAGDQPDTTKKKEDRLPQPVDVVVQWPKLPPPPAGSLGLPSAGVEAGSDSESATNKPDVAAQSPIDALTQDTSANLVVDRSAPPAENVQPDQKTELAFALRLRDYTPDREAKPAEAPQEPVMTKTVPADLPAQQAVTPRPDVKTKVAFTPLPDLTPKPTETTQPELRTKPAVVSLAISWSSAPQLASTTQERIPSVTPIKSAQPAQQSAAAATPAVIAVSSHEGATAEAGSNSNNGHASEKETPKTAQQLTAEPKSFRQAGATSQIVTSASKETPLQTPVPTLTVAAPAPLTASASEASSTVTVTATPAEVVSTPAPVQPNPASQVTEVSVTIPVPRADSTGNDNVAIRMMQRGSEIHVSVRTPDTQLAESLRHDLGKLVTGLEQGGFRTETWRTTPTGAAAQSNTNSQHQSSQGNPQRDAAGSDGRSAGYSGQSAGEQKRKQQDERPRWVAELEQQRNR